MDTYKTKARRYKKKTGDQWSIPLYKGHPFHDQQDVIIISVEDLHQLQSKINQLENEEGEKIKMMQVELDAVKDQLIKLQQEHNKVTNKRDHDKERLIKALKEVSQREQVIRELQGRSIFDRIFNRIPDHIQLPASKNNDDK